MQQTDFLVQILLTVHSFPCNVGIFLTFQGHSWTVLPLNEAVYNQAKLYKPLLLRCRLRCSVFSELGSIPGCKMFS